MHNFGQIVLPTCILFSHFQTVGRNLGIGQADFGMGMHGQGHGIWNGSGASKLLICSSHQLLAALGQKISVFGFSINLHEQPNTTRSLSPG